MRTLHSSGRIMVPRTMNLWSKKFKEVNFTWMYMIFLYTHIHTTISDFHVSIIRWRTSCLSWKSQLNFCSIFFRSWAFWRLWIFNLWFQRDEAPQDQKSRDEFFCLFLGMFNDSSTQLFKFTIFLMKELEELNMSKLFRIFVIFMLMVKSAVLHPQDVVLVVPPESVHRRNLASRQAADALKVSEGPWLGV